MEEHIIEVERMEQAVSLFGSYDANTRLIEQAYGVHILIRDTEIKISGEQPGVMMAAKTVKTVLQAHRGLRPAVFSRFTNRVAAYMKELEPIKNAVLTP